ncbi:hypothetical protein Tco_0868894 [Tanacetum coccineum]
MKTTKMKLVIRKQKKGKRRKGKKGAANDDEDDDVWTGESEEDAELIKKLKNDPKPKYSTRSKDQKKSKKGASTSKCGKDTTKSYAMDVDVEDDEEDEADETLGGFIVDDEDVGEGIGEDVDEETDVDDDEEEFEEDEDDEYDQIHAVARAFSLHYQMIWIPILIKYRVTLLIIDHLQLELNESPCRIGVPEVLYSTVGFFLVLCRSITSVASCKEKLPLFKPGCR